MGNWRSKLKYLPAGYYNPVLLVKEEYYEKYEVTNNESGREEILEVFRCKSPSMDYLTRYFNCLDTVKICKCQHLVQYSYYNRIKKRVVIIRPKFKERLVDRISNLSEEGKIREYQKICECVNELHLLTLKPSSPSNVQSVTPSNTSDIICGGISLSDFYIGRDINHNEIVVMDNYAKYLLYKAVNLPYPITVENVNTLSFNFMYSMSDNSVNANESVSKNDDLWSVGCILYKLLKNIYPFEGIEGNINVNEIKENIRNNRIRDYSDLERKFRHIINKTITTDSKNFTKMKYIKDDIDNIVKSIDNSNKVVVKPEAPPPPPPPPSIPEPILLPCTKEEKIIKETFKRSEETNSINFNSMRFGDKTIKSIVDYFCRRLQNRDLSQVKNDVINNQEIECLNLEGNRITHEGMSSLVTIFTYMPKLNRLYLNSNNFGNKGVMILADNLQYLPNLKTLDISHNKIKDEGLYYLSNKCKRGLTVYLNKNKYSDFDSIKETFNRKKINIGDSRC